MYTRGVTTVEQLMEPSGSPRRSQKERRTSRTELIMMVRLKGSLSYDQSSRGYHEPALTSGFPASLTTTSPRICTRLPRLRVQQLCLCIGVMGERVGLCTLSGTVWRQCGWLPLDALSCHACIHRFRSSSALNNFMDIDTFPFAMHHMNNCRVCRRALPGHCLRRLR